MPQPEAIDVLPGMTASVRLDFNSKDVQRVESFVSIPSAAVFAGDDAMSYVWVVDPDQMTVQKRKVKLGSITGTASIQVLNGLQSGERLAVAAVNSLREGQKVKLMQ